MPADRTPDLAALDALYQAATPGEWKPQMRDGSRFADGSLVMLLMADGGIAAYDIAEPDARWIAALHNAWPAIKRRLEIGDAAVAENAALRAEVERLKLECDDARFDTTEALDRAYDD